MRSNLLASAVVAGLAIAGLAVPGQSHAQTVTKAEVEALQAQIAQLQAQVQQLQARSDAQSEVNVAQAKTNESVQASQDKVDALAKTVNDTQLSGRMFFDLSNINQQDHGVDTDASGNGFDVKRFYLGVNHKFDDVWSVNLTTDFQYNSALDSAADIYVKKAYVQGKFSDAFTGRIGAADMPWIPYAESFYGYRYVENTLVDRLKYGTSSDWGLHALGDVGTGKNFNYAVSVVTGGGYKNPSRSKGMDIEGRIGFVPAQNMVIALGAYSGTLGKETENIDAAHTANRWDAMVAYAGPVFRVGAEYFQAKDWAVLNPLSDKADGYSLWGSYALTQSGIAVFGRYDRANLSKDLNPDLEDKYFNLGVEFPIRKGVKLAAVYKNDHKTDNAATDLKTREFGVFGDIQF